MSMSEKIPYSTGYARLVAEGKTGKRPKDENPTRLPIDEIAMAHSVFQPRSFEGNAADGAAHTSTLASALRGKPDHFLDPIVVWWSGERWRVIDGHHRHVAYVQTTRDPKRPLTIGPVPVTVFTGTLTQARVEAIRLNSKDKLPMTRADKLDQAWRLVAHGKVNQMSKSEIAAVTTVAERTVANMRSTHAVLLTKMQDDGLGTPFPVFTPDDLLDMRWADALKQTRSAAVHDDEWVEAQAKDWSIRFAKVFGMKLATNYSISARALQLYSEKLPERLVEVWRDMVIEPPWEDEDDTPTPSPTPAA